jgi:alpha-L-glutamate ligase-like protein
MFFNTYKSLNKHGILGMNQRNADYIAVYNPRNCYPLVDNKLATKQLALKAGIAVPELYYTVTMEHEVAQIGEILNPYNSFVIKPAHGSGGDGIVIIHGRRHDKYRRGNGTLLQKEELQYHLSSILSGMFSLGGHEDYGMIEALVEFDPLFEDVTYQGVPDIRVIVFQGYPIMAMARLPTRQSHGKANLHQGAVGVGIEITSGITTDGVMQNEIMTAHPDTGNTISGLEIPDWDTLLYLAARCYELTGLGYMGVDIVLDKNRGPLILELNARPGLSIQIANRAGLLPRLQLITAEGNKKASAEEKVAFVKKNLHRFKLIP